MSDVRNITYRIIKIDVVILAVLIIISLVFANDADAYVKGYVFGGIIGILNFILLGKTIEKAVVMPPKKAMFYTRLNYFIRFLLTGFVIYVSIKADYINTICVIIGLLLIKYIIMIYNFCIKKRTKTF